MKLLTVDLKKKFAKIGSQDSVEDPFIIAKYFICFSDWTFYATEFDPTTEIFFGIFSYADQMHWGTISLHELENIGLMGGRIKVERNTFFQGIRRMSEEFGNLKIS
jgi:hypothetical protein